MHRSYGHDPTKTPSLPLLPMAQPATGCDALGFGPEPAYRAIWEETVYRNRDVVADRNVPVHPWHPDPSKSGQAGLVELSTKLRPCFAREPAGSHLSIRNQARPLGLIMTPLHYEVQLPHDISRDRIFERVEDSKCPRPSPCVSGGSRIPLHHGARQHGNTVQVRPA